MRTLTIVIISLSIGFGAGYFWNTWNTTEESATETETTKSPSSLSNQTGDSESEQTTTSEGGASDTAETVETVVVDTNVLSPEQRKLLETFGIEADSIEVTADMIACAKEKVGEARFEEILSGDTPSFFEGLSLAACYQQ